MSLTPKTSPSRKFGRILGETLLSLAALGGLACMVLVILGWTMNISLVMFKTGSMEPSIPAGSVAVVREISASQIEVGDVVTVDRDGQLPVTHRVTAIQEPTGETASDLRTFTMKGDANDFEDPVTYNTSTVRIVLGSIPGLANVITWFSNPVVLGALTIAASLLVVWAFWPRRSRDETVSVGYGVSPALSDTVPPVEETSRATIPLAMFIGVASLTSLHDGENNFLNPAQHLETEVIESEIISLTSIRDTHAMSAMVPEVPVHWQIGVHADTDEPGRVNVSYWASGDPTLQLDLDMRTCSEQWHNGVCNGNEELVGDPQLHLDQGEQSIFSMSADETQWLLITAQVPQEATGTVSLTVHAAGMGDDAAVTPGGSIELAETGGHFRWMIALAMVTLLTGILLASVFRRRHRRTLIRPKSNKQAPWSANRRKQSALLVVLAVCSIMLVPKPESTFSAWTDRENGAGTLTAATGLRPAATTCQNRPGEGQFGTQAVRLTWEPGTPGTRYRINVYNRSNRDSMDIDVGTQNRYLMRSLFELGLLNRTQTLELRVIGTYTSPNGNQWTMNEPEVTLVEYDPGLFRGDLSCLE